jgi:hypothetical protein
MRKKILLLITMFLGALYVGCSSDDGYLSYELDEDAKLQNTKNLILSYGQKYGLSNIQFNDELLRKNLDLPKEEYERDIICMAISVGKLKPSSKILRKTRRSSGFGDNDPNPGGKPNNEPDLYISGSADVSNTIDSIVFKFTLNYEYNLRGYGCVRVKDEHAYVYKLRKCKERKCGIIHPLHEVNIYELASCSSELSSPPFRGSYTSVVGAQVHLIADYLVRVIYAKNNVNKQVGGSFDVDAIIQERK